MTTTYHINRRAFSLLVTFSVIISSFAVAVPLTHADATDYAPEADLLNSNQAFILSASWNGTALATGATTTLPTGQPGTLSTTFTLNPTYVRNRHLFSPGSVSSVLSSAVLTLDLYKGVMGSSTLVYSQTISSTSSAIIFPVSFDSGGDYFLALSATYPNGTYPPGKSPAELCTGGDFCVMTKYLLSAFQDSMTRGYDLAAVTGGLAFSIPAAHGFLPFTIAPESKPLSNVLFIPGTKESRLYMRDGTNPEKELWEPVLDHDVSLLAMNPDGTSKHQIYTRDIMDYAYSRMPLLATAAKLAGGDLSVMYAPFQKFMDGLVAKNTLKEWRAYPYDWRYDVGDVVKNGTLVAEATGTPTRVYLSDLVQQLASTSPTGKVTIIGHSNGGLVAKALGVELQKAGKLPLVDRVIMVGTPQLGTPLAIGTLLHGDDQALVNGLIARSDTVRAASLTMPGPYDLLPSSAYFNKVHTPVVSFANDALDTAYRARYGTDISSSTKFTEFLTNARNSRNAPAVNDLETPAILSTTYINKARTTHDALDSWIPPASLPLISIAGWGQPTPGQYKYSSQPSRWNCPLLQLLLLQCGSGAKLVHPSIKTGDGDSVVVSPSATAAGQSMYLDTKNLNVPITHQSLLSAAAIQSQIVDSMKGVSTTEPQITTTQPTGAVDPLLVVSTHSPVIISATDENGKRSGIVTAEGFSDFYFKAENIRGSYVERSGDDNYIYLPMGGHYTFSVQAYADGQATIDIGMTNAEGGITQTQTFAAITTTASTTMTFTVAQGVATPLAVDTYGTGHVDLIASSSVTNTSTSTAIAQTEKQLKESGHYGLREWLAITLWKISNGNDSPELQKILTWINNLFSKHHENESSHEDTPSALESVSKIDL
jgi:pimeloyl-ACP methyl ester carboxylesterase